MQILIPIAGESSFFSPEEYPFPKPLIEIGGLPMIERVIKNLQGISPDARFIFIVRDEDVSRYSLDSTLRLLTNGNCELVVMHHPAKGALCSALMAIDLLDEEDSIVIANGDQVIEADLKAIVNKFADSEASAGVITFESIHPRWSYAILDENNRVLQAAEKRVISRNAIAGFYFFKNARTFIETAKGSIRADGSLNGQFYIAPSLNELILNDHPVISHHIPADAYHSFYAPQKIAEFEKRQLIQSIAAPTAPTLRDLRVVIPAAGEGSRFRTAGYDKPKPFIDVLGRPMITYVLDNVTPPDADVHLLLREDHLSKEKEMVSFMQQKGYHIASVDKLTEGTACTLLLIRGNIDDERPMLVANSDQFVDFDVSAFVEDCFKRGLDGSILVFRDPSRNPKWSFAKLDEKGLVVEVAEKKPISDLATVGIYLFTSGRSFVQGAVDMIARNDRVNNEFYTAPVYNYMIANGCRIGVYEVPADAMHGLGTPEDLELFLDRHR